MIRSIEIENFKAFGDAQRIDLKPITLIFGANSAGKSSIIHSLLWAHEAITRGNLDVHKPRIAGTSVDLGGFRQFVHKRNLDSHVGFNIELDCGRLQGRLAELLAPVSNVVIHLTVGCKAIKEPPPAKQNTLFDIQSPQRLPHVPSVRLGTYSLVGDGRQILSMSSRRDGSLRIDEMDHDHVVFREIYRALEETVASPNSVGGLSVEKIKNVIDEEVLGSLTARGSNLLPMRVLDIKQSSSIRERLMRVATERAGEEPLARTIRMFFVPTLNDLIQLITQAVRREFHRLSYLGPLRTFPPRHLSYVDNDDPNWHSGGGNAWEVVRDDETIREMVNAWLGSDARLQTPYRLMVREMAAIDQIEDHLYKGLEELSKHGLEIEQDIDDDGKASGAYPLILDIEKEAGRLRRQIEFAQIDKARELSLIDIRRNTIVSHRDVGIGISQVLPVLVQAYASRFRILAMEQPEIHLHPKLQAELGDVFIESALGPQQNRFLLETHSEHVILRIMRRIRESNTNRAPETPPIQPKDVCLLHVGEGKGGSTVQELRIDERGRLIDRCPGGFFEEDFNELF